MQHFVIALVHRNAFTRHEIRPLVGFSHAHVYAKICQYPDPPKRVEGAPKFAARKKRGSYYEEFKSKRDQFNEDRIRARKLSEVAALRTQEVGKRGILI